MVHAPGFPDRLVVLSNASLVSGLFFQGNESITGVRFNPELGYNPAQLILKMNVALPSHVAFLSSPELSGGFYSMGKSPPAGQEAVVHRAERLD